MEKLNKNKYIEENYFYRKHKDGTYEIISIIDKSLKDVFIPDLVTKICDNAFSNCKNLFSVVIPESVGKYAFYGCNNLTIKSNHKEPSEMWSKFWNKLDLFNNLVPVEWEG